MSKRRADVELNQDNWDKEPEVKSEGIFTKADKSVISDRKILTAKSRKPAGYGTSGIFKSFTGFSENTPNGQPNFSFNFGARSVESSSENNSISESNPALSSSLEAEKEYLKQLQILNQNFLDWITKHLHDDPHCILSPVFIDYDRHLKALEERFPNRNVPFEKESNKVSDSDRSSLSSTFPNLVPFTVFPNSPSNQPPLTTNATLLTSVSTTANINVPTNPTFTFGFPPLTSTTSTLPLFKFGTSLPSSSPFASVDNAAPECTTTADDDDEVYKPPEPVVKEIKEEGSVYSTRCKLFYKADADWRERGVGNLFIKPSAENKFQLLVRADTNLGNILLNVLITKEIPIKQQKNNLTLVCVPFPPFSTSMSKASEEGASTAKPVPILVRVKTEEDAVELLKIVNQYRGVLHSDSTA